MEIGKSQNKQQKKNQNNYSEHDPGSQKKNGGKDWEDARNVYQRPRRTKEQTNRDEYYTRRNSQQNNWGRSIDKWPGEQNGGNHCCKTEYRKKRIKRNEDSLRDLWDNITPTNIHIIGVSEEEKREKGPEKIFEELKTFWTWERK